MNSFFNFTAAGNQASGRVISLQPASASFYFSVDFGAPVWRVRPDHPAGFLALEIRDGDRLQTEFTGIDIVTGKLLGPSFRAAESWWVGLEDAHNQRIYLHGFADRRVGAHRGITAVNLATRQVVWQREEVAFYSFGPDEVIIARAATGDDFVLLDGQNGDILEPVVAPATAHEWAAAFARQRATQEQHPVHYPAGSEHFVLLSQFISARAGRQPIGAIDYLETTLFFGLAYYVAAADNKVKNILAVYAAQDGALWHEVVLTEAGPGISPGTFFLMRETMLFVQERNTLVGCRF